MIVVLLVELTLTGPVSGPDDVGQAVRSARAVPPLTRVSSPRSCCQPLPPSGSTRSTTVATASRRGGPADKYPAQRG